MKTNSSLGAIHPHLFFLVLCIMALLMSTFLYHTVQHSFNSSNMMMETVLKVKANNATALK
ncbi:MAG: hypothetical protein ACM3VS_05265 [Candidatus Dadabacteria bacterium]